MHGAAAHAISDDAARRLLAQARTPADGMNRVERAYSVHLQVQLLVGAIRGWRFQEITLKLGPDCRYTPDFLVELADGTIALDDCKGTKRNKVTGGEGYWAEADAMVKIRAAASQFKLFRIRVCWLTSQGWQVKEIV